MAEFKLKTILIDKAYKKVSTTTVNTDSTANIYEFVETALRKLGVCCGDSVEVLQDTNTVITVEVMNMMLLMLGFEKLIVEVKFEITEKELFRRKLEIAAFEGDLCCN